MQMQFEPPPPPDVMLRQGMPRMRSRRLRFTARSRGAGEPADHATARGAPCFPHSHRAQGNPWGCSAQQRSWPRRAHLDRELEAQPFPRVRMCSSRGSRTRIQPLVPCTGSTAPASHGSRPPLRSQQHWRGCCGLKNSAFRKGCLFLNFL